MAEGVDKARQIPRGVPRHRVMDLSVGDRVRFRAGRPRRDHPEPEVVAVVTEIVPAAFTSPPSAGVRTDIYPSLVNAQHFLEPAPDGE